MLLALEEHGHGFRGLAPLRARIIEIIFEVGVREEIGELERGDICEGDAMEDGVLVEDDELVELVEAHLWRRFVSFFRFGGTVSGLGGYARRLG